MKTPRRLSSIVILFGLAASGAQRAAGGEGVLIEAERYTQRVPDDNSFAVPMKSASAYGGMGLAKFFGSGHVVYDCSLPREGTYYLWARYASNQDQPLYYAFGAAAEPARARAARARLNAKGSLDAWRWARLGEVRLATGGTYRLTLHATPARLDCIWVSTTDQPPSDSDIAARALDATREHLQNPIEPVAPAWLAAADTYQLPAWYDAIRVCAHTRLSWRMRSSLPNTFDHAGRLFRLLGFSEVSRHIKSGSEPAWWPSAVGAVFEEARTRNYAKEIIDEAHANGCRIIVYSRHMEDEFLATRHPEWRARDDQGRNVIRRGAMMCLNTPYADFMETRLVELAAMGADGFYFDEVHMVKPICYCDSCRTGFEQVTGRKYPAASTPADPLYQKAIEYRNTVLERVFRRWRAAVHQASPECVMLIGSNTYPAMNDRHTTHRLWRIADAMKSEFNLAARPGNNRLFASDPSLAAPEPDARIALGYTLNRDACDGRPPHVWAHGIPDATQMQFATAGMIAHGQVANLDHDERTIPDFARFAPAVALGNRVSPGFAGSRPLRWAAVHFSEHARDHYVPDESAMWKQVLYPVYGAFTALLRAHLPVGIVTDSQLEQGRLDGYRILFLPAARHLTGPMRDAVEQFRRRGGLVVEQDPAWEWHRPGTGMQESTAALLAAIGHAATLAPVQAHGGTEKMHMVPFLSRDGKRLTISLVNDFSWVKTGAAAKPAAGASTSQEGENEPAPATGAPKPPPPCRDVRVVVRLPAPPASIRDLVTDEMLSAVPGPDGFVIHVPEFECMSVLVLDLAPAG